MNIFPGLLIILLLFSCFGLTPEESGTVENDKSPSPGSNISVPGQDFGAENKTNDKIDETEITSKDLEFWTNITKKNVETICLKQAKEEAGDKYWAVKSCACNETSIEGRKTYSCDIDTLDPTTNYFANIDCFFKDKSCIIESNNDKTTMTFQDLEKLEN